MYSRQYDNSPRFTDGGDGFDYDNVQTGYEANVQNGFEVAPPEEEGFGYDQSGQSGYDQRSGYSEQRTSM